MSIIYSEDKRRKMYINGERFKVYKTESECTTFWKIVKQFTAIITALFFGLAAIAALFGSSS